MTHKVYFWDNFRRLTGYWELHIPRLRYGHITVGCEMQKPYVSMQTTVPAQVPVVIGVLGCEGKCFLFGVIYELEISQDGTGGGGVWRGFWCFFLRSHIVELEFRFSGSWSTQTRTDKAFRST